ncbi:TPR repeat-containing protein [Thecamonas trahens ATCC 50062]|uniref:TPR repeat-containing protein n=1 Tax=Thecamonas trahens ATCC 50062 TaxID=461836 RepID=A0A0L0DVH0_THETB|nr:TPR repeat-containing protein [Thecamonas trahens ATCC 50062]KNC56167.1 TPR repeat-containing protein [Thecamonas trahens ATCC 50062]|eukprot:XP_013761203.1 TPR repeat-containing protein [Thecamonas trahens ATCC 50062]
MAYEATDASLLRAEAAYLAGRVWHVRKDYTQANEFYKHAVMLRPNYPLALYAAAQMNVHRNHLTKALDGLRRLLKYAPNNFEALVFIGSLYARQQKRADALKALRAALALEPDHVETLIEYAQLIDSHSPAEALAAYTKAYDALVAGPGGAERIPAALHNNIGILQGVLGEFEAAEASFSAAYAALGMPDKPFAPLNRTVTFNRARALEDARRFAEARSLYSGLAEAFPEYVEPHLRLGCIARTLGRHQEASDHVKDAFAINPNDINAWSLRGSLNVEKKELQPAQKAFEHILGRVNKSDPYALLALGNIFYQSVRPSDAKTTKWLKRALTFFKQVLRADASNLFAANGIGIVLADKGQIGAAKVVFDSVREASSEFPDVYVNLGHCALAQKQYVKAITLYETALAKSADPHDVTILLFIARALFDQKLYAKARAMLSRCLRLEPTNIAARFDLALTIQSEAVAKLKLPESQRPVTVVKSAIRLLQHARSEYEYLYANNLASRAKEYIEYCDSALEDASLTLDAAEILEESLRSARARREAEEAAAAAAAAEAAAAAAAAAAAEAAEKAAIIQEDSKMLAIMRQNWENAPKTRKRKRKKTSQAAPSRNDLPEPEWEDDQDNPYMPGEGSGSGLGSGAESPASPPASPPPAADPTAPPPAKKRKTVVDSDSDDDDDNAGASEGNPPDSNSGPSPSPNEDSGLAEMDTTGAGDN